MQERVGRRLRQGGMGCSASLFEWKSGDVRRIVRWGDTIPGSYRKAATPGGNMSDGDGVELPRWMDVSGRSIRTVVQRIVDERVGNKHHAAEGGTRRRSDGRQAGGAADFLPWARIA